MGPREIFTRSESGILVPSEPVEHRPAEYDDQLFDLLLAMQEKHFWYRGRHRFLYGALRRFLEKEENPSGFTSAIDLGGGCGGWMRFLSARASGTSPELTELALADSSLAALESAGTVLNPDIDRYQVDLASLPWRDRWDVAFLLDVLEHLPDDAEALNEVAKSVRPGGLVFVTVPALDFFWSKNDLFAQHQRRYSLKDLVSLAALCGLEPIDVRYFMFILSTLVFVTRRLERGGASATSPEEAHAYLRRSHRVPIAPLNRALTLAFAAETPLGLKFGFPWGTSALAVLRRPG